MEEDDERTEELTAITAIYPELELDPAHPFAAKLDLPVTPARPLKIHFQSSTQAAPPNILTPPTTVSKDGARIVAPVPVAQITAALNVDVHQLSHLPPLKLEIDLPEGYPVDKPPNVTIRSDPAWLPQKTLDAIQSRCEELWEEYGKGQVVFSFIDYVREEAEKAFGLADNADYKFELSSDLKLILLDYDLKRKQAQFDNETFDCGICLEPKKGRTCHRLLLCGHVFCVECLQDFYNNCIKEGDVDNVKCLDPSCGKDTAADVSPGKKRKIDRTLNPSELLQIPIQQETVQRYVKMKRKRRLEADKNTIYCPRQWCQGAARSKKHPKSDDPLHDAEDSDDEPEQQQDTKPTRKKKQQEPEDIPMNERLAICEDCNYAFCSVCRKGWHGEMARCNPRRQAELNAEEQASLDYMSRYSTPCPTCSAPAQKTYGCNHMICFKCKTHFCYLCSSYLMPDNPYRHFNDLKSQCYMRLWELEGGDGEGAGHNFGGIAAPQAWEVPDDEESNSDDESDMSDEDFAEFGGDDPVAWDNEDDTDDEEPAPDQRRANRPAIEIVRPNGVNQRIELPGQANRPRAAPPHAPAPPRRGQNRVRGGVRRQQVRAPPQQPAPRVVVDAHVVNGEPLQAPVAAAPGQGNNADVALQRFLRLALQDREDEWDSDEDEPAAGERVRHRERRRV